MSENLLPWKRSDLWESIFLVLRVHGLNLFFRWSSQYFDDLNQLVDSTFSREDGLAKHELGDDAAHGPNINGSGVVGVSKDQLRGTVVP